MIINLATVSWGPQFLVPTIEIEKYFGCVVFREKLDDELLKKELEALRIVGYTTGVTNAWYVRKKGNQTWIRVGESSNRRMDFAVRFDSTEYENGAYQVLGFMSVKVKAEDREIIVSRQNIANMEIKN